MKTCEQCGNPVPEEKAFCPNCGAAMIEERGRTTEVVEGMGETLFEPVPTKTPPTVKPPTEKPAQPPAEASAKPVKAAAPTAAAKPERPRMATAKRPVTPKAAAKSPPAEQNGKLYLILYVSAALFLLALLVFAFMYMKGKI